MAKEPTDRRTPGVVFQPLVYRGVQGGINTLAQAIRPTLGPLHGIVAVEKESKVGKPELLDDGATIARRIIQLPNRAEDMGAMYFRQTLWQMSEAVGDGTATAAMLFQAIFNEGLRYIVAGGNAMRLRQHLEAGAELIAAKLESMVFHLRGKTQLAQMAEAIGHDAALARLLGEIFDNIGEDGRLDITSGRGRELGRTYVEGMYWEGGLFSRAMLLDPTLGRTQLENASILVSDLEIKEPQELLPVLDLAVRAEVKALLIIANAFSDQATSLLLNPANREKILVIAAKAPARDAVTRQQRLQDLALLTGGRAFFQAAGDTLNSVGLADLGRARRAWADLDNFGLVGGKGDPCQVRRHIAQLRAGLSQADGPSDRKRLQEQLGYLLAGSAILSIGDDVPQAVDTRKALAERTAQAMRGAIREGVLPGGGTALLACQSVLQEKAHQAEEADERAAYRILLKALETPFRTIVANAGFAPDKALDQVTQAGPGFGFDVIHGQVVDMAQAGLCDAASVVKAAVFSAIHGAALALTIDILVHRKDPPLAQTT